MPEIGYASMAVIPTFKGLQGDLERGSSKALSAAGVSGGAKFGESASKSAKRKFSASAKSIVAPLLGAFAAVKVGDFFKDAVTGASDLAESTNKVQQVFGKGTGAVFKFTSGAAKAIGQTNQQARDAAATFGIFGKAAKFTDKQNAKFSIRMTTLASDLASFHNTSPEQAIEAIGAALRGESEPIRAYGVLLDEATLKAEAMRIGLVKPTKDKAKIQSYQVAILSGQQKYNEAVKKHGKDSLEALKAEANLGTARDRLKKATEGTIAPLTQQQKVMAAQSAIMRQTTVAQGDFQRTSGGLANQQRILSARWTDAKAAIGTALLPMVNKAVKYLNDEGIPAFERFADFFQKKGIPALKDFGRKATPVVRDVIGKARDFLKEAQPYAEGFVAAFNKLPKGVKTGAAAAALLGFGATKVPGVKGAAGAGASAAKAALSIALPKKPIPVIVVNKAGVPVGTPGTPTPTGTPGKVVSVANMVVKTAASIAIMKAGSKLLKDFTSSDKGPGKVDATQAARNVKTAHGIEPDWNLPIIGGTAKHNAKEDLKGTDSKLAGMINAGDVKSAKAQFAAITAEAKKQKISLSDLRDSFPQYYAAIDSAKTKTKALAQPFDTAKVHAQHLNNEVKLIGSNARNSRAEVQKLLAALDKARSDSVKLQQGVSAARTGKVDRQLDRGGVTVIHNGDIKSDSPRDYVKNAQKVSRHASGGGVSVP